jgi:hypothetical protein
VAALAAAVLAAGAVAVVASLSQAQPAQPPGPAPAPNPPALSRPALAHLPIAQVILYSSGVGYFQREGTVEGDARVDLTFRVEDINDLLKSMVLQDLGGGHVSLVSYDSRDPVERSLKSFALDLTANPSLAQLLNQARGERVEVTMQQTVAGQPGTLVGTVVGVEMQKLPAGQNAVVDAAFLNLLAAEGLRSCKLADVQRVRFLNPVVDQELKRALDVLALAHDAQKKAVSITFTGEGKRPVRVGYVTEAPLWKTSYRLVLDKEQKPFLQGWAVVENTSDEDWTEVRMALVSGRPISFRMDLYQPLYVPRPLVEPELFASLRPVAYGGAMDDLDKAAGKQVQEAAPPGPGSLRRGQGGAAPGKEESEFHQGRQREVLKLSKGREDAAYADEMNRRLSERLDLRAGISPTAAGAELGDYFQYVIRHPVTLARQKSALLPIAHTTVDGPRVSIYNEQVQPKHPLLGLKFKNTSGLHLMQGPITVFDGASYAGDARILDLQPQEERLLSYAIDLGTEVAPISKRDPDRLIQVKINRGVLYRTDKVRELKTYTIKNRSEQDRTLILEHPFRPDFKLIVPEKYAERTRDVYRFELTVPAGQEAKHEVVEERDVVSTVALSTADDQVIRVVVQSPVTSPQVQAALRQAQERRNRLAETQRDLAQAQRLVKEIAEDQARVRANLAAVPPTSKVYKTYLEKFEQQEAEVERLRGEIKRLQELEHQQRKEYDTFLANLTVE